MKPSFRGARLPPIELPARLGCSSTLRMASSLCPLVREALEANGRRYHVVAPHGDCFWLAVLMQVTDGSVRRAAGCLPDAAEVRKMRQEALDFISRDDADRMFQHGGIEGCDHLVGTWRSDNNLPSPSSSRVVDVAGWQAIQSITQLRIWGLPNHRGFVTAIYFALAIKIRRTIISIEDTSSRQQGSAARNQSIVANGLRSGTGGLTLGALGALYNTVSMTMEQLLERWRRFPQLRRNDVVLEFRSGSHYDAWVYDAAHDTLPLAAGAPLVASQATVPSPSRLPTRPSPAALRAVTSPAPLQSPSPHTAGRAGSTLTPRPTLPSPSLLPTPPSPARAATQPAPLPRRLGHATVRAGASPTPLPSRPSPAALLRGGRAPVTGVGAAPVPEEMWLCERLLRDHREKPAINAAMKIRVSPVLVRRASAPPFAGTRARLC